MVHRLITVGPSQCGGGRAAQESEGQVPKGVRRVEGRAAGPAGFFVEVVPGPNPNRCLSLFSIVLGLRCRQTLVRGEGSVVGDAPTNYFVFFRRFYMGCR